jgi:beta-glucosidase
MSISNDIRRGVIDHTLDTQTDMALAAAFPAQFLWGAATASYQIEGAIHEGGRGISIWDTFSATPGKTFRGETGAVAADHYHRMPEDVALMAQLGLGAYRFSIAWPRIQPTGTGAVNQQGLDFYDRLVDALLTYGIQPFVTLYHWDLPQALQDQGGWENRDTAQAFADYAEIVAQRLGDRVAGWITHNEPWCAAFLGYGIGVHAPGLKNRQAAIQVGHHLLLSHGLTVPRLRAASKPGTPVGITLNFNPLYPADDRPETQHDLEVADAFSNRWFLDPLYRGSYPDLLFTGMQLNPPEMQEGDMAIIGTPIDFLGVNNYSRTVIRGRDASAPLDSSNIVAPVPGACYTEMGWEIYPQGLTDLLVRLHREYAVPALYVTENGAAFADHWDGQEEIVRDPRRVSYLREHIQAIASALEQGAPLKGYFVWSLIDNFEWAEGYSKRFGIVYIDYASQRRVLKASGKWYADFIAAYKQAHQV